MPSTQQLPGSQPLNSPNCPQTCTNHPTRNLDRLRHHDCSLLPLFLRQQHVCRARVWPGVLVRAVPERQFGEAAGCELQ